MKYTVKHLNKFQKDVKKAQKRGYDMSLLFNIVNKLANGESLPIENRNHPLTGNYKGFYECHIAPDWLLIYKIKNNELVLVLFRTGTHSDLF